MLKCRLLKADEVFGRPPSRLVSAFGLFNNMSENDLITFWNDKGPYTLISELKLHDAQKCGEDNDGKIEINTISPESTSDYAVVPVLSYDDSSDVMINKGSKVLDFGDGIKQIEYGYYPTKMIDRDTRNYLDDCVTNKSIQFEEGPAYYNSRTGKIEKMDMVTHYGIQYCRVRAKNLKNADGPYSFFSKNYGVSEYIPEESYIWFGYEPIKWLVDTNAKMMITEGPITHGVPTIIENGSEPKTLEETNFGEYLEQVSKDIVKGVKLEKVRNIEQSGTIINVNPRPTPQKEEEDKSDEDQIGEIIYKKPQKKPLYDYKESGERTPDEQFADCIEANIPVMLHGLSGVGKTGRVKEVDPNPQVVSLFTRTKEEILGNISLNKDTGEIRYEKPYWLQQLEEKCEKEPDKIHVLFFDEITLGEQDDIQKAAYEIILERTVRDGRWKLPEKVRIVAAGNSQSESEIAQDLPLPLYSRLAHVKIETTPEQWIRWASKSGIHPAIIAYITYKSSIGDDVLRTKYTGESPHADPRRWEMASKMLKNKEIPETLEPIIGERLCRDFADFVRTPVYSIEDVLQFPLGIRSEFKKLSLDEKYPTVFGLSQVDEEHVKEVRAAVKYLGSEFVALFDNLWTMDQPDRIDKIMEIKATEWMEEEQFYDP